MCLFMAAGAAAAAGTAAAGASSMATMMGVMQMGLGIAQGIASYQGQMAEYDAQKDRIRREEIQAQKTLNLQVSQQSAALESEKDRAQGEKAEASIQGYAAESRAKTASAEAGIVGLSVDNLVGSIRGETGRFNSRVDFNSQVATENANNELSMAQRGGAARMASIPIPTKPSFLPTAIGIGSGIVSGLGRMSGSQSAPTGRYG